MWVSASAGSGKTKVLTDRVLALLLAGNAPERILCLTFTKAAAAEMSNRIAEKPGRLGDRRRRHARSTRWRAFAPNADSTMRKRARRLFAEVLDAPGGLQISTIHAFCQSLLGRFPIEAGIAPHFTVMDERDSAEALARAQEDTIAAARGGGDAALRRAMAVITARVHETNFADLMAGLVAGARQARRACWRHERRRRRRPPHRLARRLGRGCGRNRSRASSPPPARKPDSTAMRIWSARRGRWRRIRPGPGRARRYPGLAGERRIARRVRDLLPNIS